jgi:hypothetical protein
MIGRVTAGLLTLLLIPGCGEEGRLSLRLLQAGFDKPYDGLDTFRLRVLDADLQERKTFDVAAGAGSLELGVVSSGAARLEVLGLAGGQTISRGQSRPLALESGSTLEETIPFATPSVAVAQPTSEIIAPALVVDGNLGEWQGSPSLVLDRTHRVAGAEPAAADLRAELYLAWDGGQLAFALDVSDDCPALRAGLPAGTCGTATAPERVYLGFDGDDDGTDYGTGDLWIALSATSLTVVRGTASPSQLAVVFAPRRDLGGWIVEGSIKVSALGRSSLTTKDRVGMELVLVDADPGEAQPSALRWSGGSAPADQPTAPSAMGTVGFGQP